MDHFYEVMFNYVGLILQMPEHDKDLCRRLFKPLVVPADTLLQEAGTIPKHHYFIVSGYMRKYTVNEDHEEITIELNEGPRFFSSYFHFLTQGVSQENIRTITACELLTINRPDVEIAANEGITQKDYSVQILNQYSEINKQRAVEMANLSAEKRYEKFCKEHPELIRHVPLKYIASLLGITQRHLSRLRQYP